LLEYLFDNSRADTGVCPYTRPKAHLAGNLLGTAPHSDLGVRILKLGISRIFTNP